MRINDRFPSVNEQMEGRWVRFRMITCDKCGYPSRMKENTQKALPPEFLARKFRERGWEVGQANICPRCQQGKPAMAPAARRAAFCAINNTKRAVPPAKPEEHVMAQAPRVPTPEERRRVRDALDEHYLENKGCYAKAFSDKSLAAKLDLPSAWVTELREAMGLGPDANEAAAIESAEIAALKEELAKLSDEFMNKASALEGRVRKLEIGRSYAA